MISIDIQKKLSTYGGQQVLRIKRELVTGSITKISGLSGAGKSTLLKILAGLVKPEQGIVRFEDEVWFDAGAGTNLSPQNRQVGFVFQDYALFPNMTVYEHLRYATADEDWIKRLLEIGKLETLSQQKPVYLSGGQQQRLAILRALVIKPRLLLMDEPFSALDRQTKTGLINELKNLFAEFTPTVLIVSHNLSELESFTGEEFAIGE